MERKEIIIFHTRTNDLSLHWIKLLFLDSCQIKVVFALFFVLVRVHVGRRYVWKLFYRGYVRYTRKISCHVLTIPLVLANLARKVTTRTTLVSVFCAFQNIWKMKNCLWIYKIYIVRKNSMSKFNRIKQDYFYTSASSFSMGSHPQFVQFCSRHLPPEKLQSGPCFF